MRLARQRRLFSDNLPAIFRLSSTDTLLFHAAQLLPFLIELKFRAFLAGLFFFKNPKDLENIGALSVYCLRNMFEAVIVNVGVFTKIPLLEEE